MDEKTEQLRDIFIDVAGEETVTERQQEGHGSLADVDEGDIGERLQEVIADMRERYGFETDLDGETLAAIVRGFYEGDDDEALATDLGLDDETVFTARMDLHLIGEDDTDAPFSLATLRDLLDAYDEDATMATELEADTKTIARYRQVAAAQNRSRRASHRFRTAFEDVLTDAGLSIRLTESVQEDGLDDATDGMESNVSF